jgi:hypothetical protein
MVLVQNDNRFLSPFSRIFLENNLATPNRMFDFVMKMFSEGDAAIPALGMEDSKTISQAVARACLLFNTKVVDIQANTIITATRANPIGYCYLATEATALISKYKTTTETKHHSVTNVYFEAKVAPSNKAVVILNASEKDKIVNNLM